MKLCAVIPSHNHAKAVSGIVARLRAEGLPVLVVDDGSDPSFAATLAALHAPDDGVEVHRLPVNQGKGGAVMEGFRRAHAAGFSHALQVDADGQHDLDALPMLFAQALTHPEALIAGRPLFDASMPLGRRMGRWITHFWVCIETLSLRVRDSMCGFRLYPLDAVARATEGVRLGRRMDFDTELMVRMLWQGTELIEVPVRVIYPPGNTSNFDLWRDNVRISWMHTRLVFLMLMRLPMLLSGRIGRQRHWSLIAERGGVWGLRISVATYRLLGRSLCIAMLVPVVAWFFASGRPQRQASAEFLVTALGHPPSLRERFRHFLGFAVRSLDVLIAWSGGVPARAVRLADSAGIAAIAADPRGALMVVSHLGNAELSRAVLDEATRARMTVLVHTRHAARFNQVLREVCPDAALNVLEVTEIGPETAVALQALVASGGWVVIAGDRTPVGGNGRVSRVPFFGRAAPFPQGPWILAALLGCPVRLLFCLRSRDGWELDIETFADRVVLPRGRREAAMAEYAARYAARLEAFARRAPMQWYNFFDFWRQ
jgi:predicted LPLAT superfamily acyltransferase